MTPTPETVPFDKADIDKLKLSFKCCRVRLSGDRAVTVGLSTTGRERMLEFNAPTKDGKVSSLKFGISGEAADVLLELLLQFRSQEDFKAMPLFKKGR